MFSLSPTFTRLVFESSTTNLSLGIVPIVPLAEDHPFCIPLNDHLAAVTTSETYDALIDSYVTIVKGDHLWCTSMSPDDILVEQQNICKLLHDNSPSKRVQIFTHIL